MALLLTVTTNFLGVLTVPFFVKAVVNAGGASIDGVDLLIKLVRQPNHSQAAILRSFQNQNIDTLFPFIVSMIVVGEKIFLASVRFHNSMQE